MEAQKYERFEKILELYRKNGKNIEDFFESYPDIENEFKELLITVKHIELNKDRFISDIERKSIRQRILTNISNQNRFLNQTIFNKTFLTKMGSFVAAIILIVGTASALIINQDSGDKFNNLPFKVYKAPPLSELTPQELKQKDEIAKNIQKAVSNKNQNSNVLSVSENNVAGISPTDAINSSQNNEDDKNKDDDKNTIPESPYGLTAYAGNLENVLEWNDSNSKDVKIYRIYRAYDENGPYQLIHETDKKDEKNKFSDVIDQTELGIYYYKVSSVDSAGNESELSHSSMANFLKIEETFYPTEDKHIIASTGELMFFVPAGSLSEIAVIRINEIMNPPDMKSDYFTVTEPYEFEPSGITFNSSKPAQLTMPYYFNYQAGSENTKAIIEKGIKLMYYNENNSKWVNIQTSVDNIANTFSANITHFTTYWTGAPTDPHGTSVEGTDFCMICHGYDNSLHFQANPNGKDVCYQCHGNVSKDDPPAGATGPNIQAEFFDNLDSPGTYSRHPVPEISLYCDSCHTPHKMKEAYPTLLRVKIGGVWYYDPNDNTYCFRCHSAASTGYPNTTASVSGVYPITGTYPGQATYNTSLHNTDSDVIWPSPSYSSGYCLNCHDSHGQANDYDILRDGFSRSNFNFCFICHDGAPASTDIQALYNAAIDRAGHKTKSTGSNPTGFDAGDFKIPCYDCHNPHGSQTGNTKMVSDERWNGVDPTTAVGNRTFCIGCHIYSNDGTTTRTVEGIDSTNSNARLKLPSGMSAHESTSSQGCSGGTGGCHGDVHQPTGGASQGGLNCASSGCHPTISTKMTDWLSATYHHYIDTTTATYPAFPGTRTCLNTCHVDHNIFNSNKAANLKASFDVTDTATNNDKGLCLSCHTSAQNFPSGEQNPEGTSSTEAINQTNYEASAHYSEYQPSNEPTSTYTDATTFIAECTKCHNDSMIKTKQVSSNKFSTHDASYNAISWVSEENLCYQCHTTTGDYYGIASMDASATAIQSVFTGKTYKHPVATYSGRHRPGTDDNMNSANRHVECADCHNPHEATVANPIKGVWGVTATYGGAPWAAPTFGTISSVNYEYQICFKCHSSYVTGYGSYDKSVQFNPNNAAQHAVTENNPYLDALGHNHTGSNNMYEPWATTHLNKCSDCHGSDDAGDPTGPHGSGIQYILKAAATGDGGGSGTPLCVKCHKASTYITDDTNSSFSEHDKGAHLNNYGCRTCHMNGDSVGWPHGEDFTYPAQDSDSPPNDITPAGQKAKAFLRSTNVGGEELDAVTRWNDGGTWKYRCYATPCRGAHNPEEINIQ